MTSRNLAGWLLIIGPIVILSAFLGWPNVETAQEELAELAKNPSRSIAIMGMFVFGITVLFTGLSISSGIIAKDDTKRPAFTNVSGILFPLSIVVMVASVGLNFGAVRLYETSVDNAQAIYLIGYHITDVVGLTMGIPFIFLGLSLIGSYEDLVRRIIGVLYSIIGVCHLAGIFVDGTDALGFVSWIGMFIVSIAFGIAILRNQSK